MAIPKDLLAGEPDETVRTPGKGETTQGWNRYTQNSQNIYQGFVDANVAAGMSLEAARNKATEQYQQWGQAQHEQMYSDANAAPFGIKELAPIAGNNGLNAPLAILAAGSAAVGLGGGAAAATSETAPALAEVNAATTVAEGTAGTAAAGDLVSSGAAAGEAAPLAPLAAGEVVPQVVITAAAPVSGGLGGAAVVGATAATVAATSGTASTGSSVGSSTGSGSTGTGSTTTAEPAPEPTAAGDPTPKMPPAIPAGTPPPVTIGSVLSHIGTNLVLGLTYNALFGQKGTQPSDSLDNQARGALINAISNIEPIPVVYGLRRKAGAIVLLEVTGASNEYLNVVVVWGEGPISAIGTLYLNDVDATDSRFSGLVDRYDHLGSDTQTADAVLTAEIANSAKWSSTCTLSGVAYTYLRLKWSATAFSGGLPNITADISGRTLYDPRDASTAFSHNPALAIRDYLTNTRYGRGIDASTMIDDTAFGDAADYCDAVVSIPGGGTQARYTCDGIVDVGQKPIDNLRALLTSCRGFLVFSGGQYKLKIDKAETPVSLTLSEDNIIGSWSVSLGSKRTRYNRVKARFFNPSASWQPDIAIQDSSAFRTLDNGLLLEASQLELPFTTDAYRAGQISQIEMKRSRFGIVATLTATIAAMALEVGDVVPVTHATFGWSAKSFRVLEIELLATDEVRLTLLEYDDSVYTLDALTAVVTPPTASLPDPHTVQSPGVVSVVESQYVTANPAGVKTKATLTWGQAPDIYVQSGGTYLIEYLAPGASIWKPVASVAGGTTTADIFDLGAGTSGFGVTAINSLGVASARVSVTQEIYGLNTAPSDVANFAVQAYGAAAKFTWTRQGTTLATDLAVNLQGRIYVRYAPASSGAVWADGVLVNPDGFPGDTSIGFGPLQTGTYMAKAWNGKTYSANAASFVVTEALVTGGLSTLSTKTESSAFSGTKTYVDVVSGALQMISDTPIDSIAALIDTWGLIDSYPGIATAGEYDFAGTKMDLGSVRASRLYAGITSTAFIADDLIDNFTNNVDDWGLIDGTAVEDAEVKLQVRATNDDPNGAPTWGSWHDLGLTADYQARGFDFRLLFTSGQITHNRAVSVLSVTAKG